MWNDKGLIQKINALELKQSISDRKILEITEAFTKFYNEFLAYKHYVESIKKDVLIWSDQFEESQQGKWIEIIEKLFDFTKDTAMLAVLSKMEGNSFGELKRNLMMPSLQKQWKEKETADGIKIDSELKSKGDIILSKKKELEDKILELERQGKSNDVAKGQLEIIKLMVTDA